MIKVKQRKILITIATILVVLLAFIVCLSCLSSKTAIANEDMEEYSTNSDKLQYNQIYVSNLKSNYNVSEVIDVNFKIEGLNAITNYECESIGFDVISDNKQDHNIIFRLKYTETEVNSEFHLTVNFANGISMTDKVYSFVKQDNLFLSDASYDDAKRRYTFFAEENILDNDEETEAEENATVTGSGVDSKSSTNVLLTNEATETIRAQLQWMDDSKAKNIHPLAYTKFSIIDKGGSSPVKLYERVSR